MRTDLPADWSGEYNADIHRHDQSTTNPRPIRFASGLVVAVNVGVVLASLLFMRRMSKAVSIEEHSQEQVAADVGRGADFVLPKNTVVYSIDGPFFFGAVRTRCAPW